ncbi:MAG TPA: peptidyl-prolyl cis-trans isomerase, partial [Planctomycetota bacterium]|nr:peptidyl-prolyl cis-trans isomerase [Planctomycetota bacterium]
VDQMVSDSIRRAGTSTQLEGLLAEKGKTLQEEKQAALDNRLIRALLIREVDAHVDVTPAEMRQYYDAHAKDYARVKQVKLRQIFLDRSQYATIEEAVTKARDLLSQVRRGADFAKLAEQHSDGPYAKSGGLWEFVTEGSGTFPPEVERAAFRMAPKQVSEPIVTKPGVHLVQVEDVRPARQVPFQEVQDDIATKLREEERKRLYHEFIRKLWAKSAVEIRWR